MANRRLLPIGALIVSLIVFGGALVFALQPSASPSPASPTAIQAAATPITGTSIAVAANNTVTSAPIAEVVATATLAATATPPPSPTRPPSVTTRVASTPTTAPPVAVAPTAPPVAPTIVPAVPTVAAAAAVEPTPAPGVSAGALPPAITPAAVPPPSNPQVIPPTATPPLAPVPAKAPPANLPPVTSGAAPRSVGVPIRVVIPTIGVDAAVEQVGVTADGAMDTPADPWDTGWYAPGVKPGQTGNAAIAGHVDYHGIGPVVFWDLNKLAVGAEVLVVTDAGQTLHFVVRGSEYYTDDNAPLMDIFGPANTIDLNLITCGGTFDPTTRHYDQRLVVFTTYAGQ
jgi:hypothetical protein